MLSVDVFKYITHLGSTRAVTDPDGNVLEQFDYLPYGQKCNNSSLAVANQYKTDYLYTGKELPQFFGLDWYDSIARWQTTSGVFTSPDPLAELFYSISPYAYCAGNPLRFIDRFGLTNFDVNGTVYSIDDDFDETLYVSQEEYDMMLMMYHHNKDLYMSMRQKLMDKYGYLAKDGFVLAASFVSDNSSSDDTVSEDLFHDAFDINSAGVSWFKEYYPRIKSRYKSHIVYETQKFLYHNFPGYKRIPNAYIYRQMIPSALKSYSKSLNGLSVAWTGIDIFLSGELKASDGINTLVFAVGLIPEVGPIISASYAALDIFVNSISGQSIGDHIDEIIEDKYHYYSVPLW